MDLKHCLEELPEEFLLQVFHYLDRQALAQIVRFSKQFLRLAIPELYSHLWLVGRETGSATGLTYLLPVLWEMIHQPELAASVHSVAVLERIFDDTSSSFEFAFLEEIALAGAEEPGADWGALLEPPALRRIYAINICCFEKRDTFHHCPSSVT